MAAQERVWLPGHGPLESSVLIAVDPARQLPAHPPPRVQGRGGQDPSG
jgi:hypothetical protein